MKMEKKLNKKSMHNFKEGNNSYIFLQECLSILFDLVFLLAKQWIWVCAAYITMIGLFCLVTATGIETVFSSLITWEVIWSNDLKLFFWIVYILTFLTQMVYSFTCRVPISCIGTTLFTKFTVIIVFMNLQHTLSSLFICYLIAETVCLVYEIVNRKTKDKDEHSSPTSEAALSEMSAFAEYEKFLRIATVHEAGHAVMAYYLKRTVHRVSRSRIKVSHLDFPMASDIKNTVLIVYAGAVAEELILGEVSDGSFGSKNSDFEVNLKNIKNYLILTDSTLSKSAAEDSVNERIAALSNEFYQETKSVLSDKKLLIERVAAALIQKSELSGKALAKIIEGGD